MKLNKSLNKSIKKIILTVAIAILGTMPFTQGCSPGNSWEKPGVASSSSSVYVQTGSGQVVPVTATKTVTVTNVGALLDNVTAQLGLGTPSAAARTAYDNNRSRVSESGVVDSVTSPMWLAITNVAGASCADLVTKEAALPDAQRNFFAGVDFTKGPDTAKAQASTLNNVVHKLARAVWARDEDSGELSAVTTSAGAQFSGTNAAQTSLMMRYVCAAMTASLDAQDH